MINTQEFCMCIINQITSIPILAIAILFSWNSLSKVKISFALSRRQTEMCKTSSILIIRIPDISLALLKTWFESSSGILIPSWGIYSTNVSTILASSFVVLNKTERTYRREIIDVALSEDLLNNPFALSWFTSFLLNNDFTTFVSI